jgi:hypothetical protein
LKDWEIVRTANEMALWIKHDCSAVMEFQK